MLFWGGRILKSLLTSSAIASIALTEFWPCAFVKILIKSFSSGHITYANTWPLKSPSSFPTFSHFFSPPYISSFHQFYKCWKNPHSSSSLYWKTYSLHVLLPFDLASSCTPFTSWLRHYYLYITSLSWLVSQVKVLGHILSSALQHLLCSCDELFRTLSVISGKPNSKRKKELVSPIIEKPKFGSDSGMAAFRNKFLFRFVTFMLRFHMAVFTSSKFPSSQVQI